MIVFTVTFEANIVYEVTVFYLNSKNHMEL
jgi:hypothetical protein